MKKRDKIIFWTYILMLVIMLLTLVIMLCQPGDALVLNDTSCVNLTLNTTINTSVWVNYSYVNVTLWELVCADCGDCNISNCSSEFIDVSLFPGESWSSEQGVCGYNFVCKNDSFVNDTVVCSVHKTLSPGEDYGLFEGGCDVSFACEDVTCEDEYVGFRGITKNFRVFRNPNSNVFQLVEVDDGVDTTLLSLPVSKSFSHDFELELLCPYVDPVGFLEENDSLAQEVCYKFQPFLYSSYKLCEDSSREKNVQILELQDKLVEYGDQIQVSKYAAGKCTGELSGHSEALVTELNFAGRELENCRTELSGVKGDSSGVTWYATLISVGFLMVSGVCVVIGRKVKRMSKGE